MKSRNVIPANAESICSCCRRNHRDLHLVDGFWLGKNCAESYKLYQDWNDINSIVWIGYERKYRQIERMLGKN